VTPAQTRAALAAVQWRLQGGTVDQLRAAQVAMGGLNADGRWGTHTRDRAAAILDAASARATPEQRAALQVGVLVLHGQTSGPAWTQAQQAMGMPAPQSGHLDQATAQRAVAILHAAGMV